MKLFRSAVIELLIPEDLTSEFLKESNITAAGVMPCNGNIISGPLGSWTHFGSF